MNLLQTLDYLEWRRVSEHQYKQTKDNSKKVIFLVRTRRWATVDERNGSNDAHIRQATDEDVVVDGGNRNTECNVGVVSH